MMNLQGILNIAYLRWIVLEQLQEIRNELDSDSDSDSDSESDDNKNVTIKQREIAYREQQLADLDKIADSFLEAVKRLLNGEDVRCVELFLNPSMLHLKILNDKIGEKFTWYIQPLKLETDLFNILQLNDRLKKIRSDSGLTEQEREELLQLYEMRKKRALDEVMKVMQKGRKMDGNDVDVIAKQYPKQTEPSKINLELMERVCNMRQELHKELSQVQEESESEDAFCLVNEKQADLEKIRKALDNIADSLLDAVTRLLNGEDVQLIELSMQPIMLKLEIIEWKPYGSEGNSRSHLMPNYDWFSIFLLNDLYKQCRHRFGLTGQKREELLKQLEELKPHVLAAVSKVTKCDQSESNGVDLEYTDYSFHWDHCGTISEIVDQIEEPAFAAETLFYGSQYDLLRKLIEKHGEHAFIGIAKNLPKLCQKLGIYRETPGLVVRHFLEYPKN